MGEQNEKGQWPVRLFLETPSLGRFCVNDKLVTEQYATWVDENGDAGLKT